MKPEEKITIIIVDDHQIFRTGLRMLLDAESNLKVLDDCGTLDEAAKLISSRKPDIVLLDLNLNGAGSGDGSDGSSGSGLDLLPRIPQLSEKTNTLILTGKKDVELHCNCLKLGANGLVLKENSSQILIEAILKVYQGEVWFERALMGKMLVEMVRPQNNKDRNGAAAAAADKNDLLTAREREVIALVGEGLKNKVIAERLFISETTVRHHLTSVFNKLQIAGRLELVIYAFKHNLAKTPSASGGNGSLKSSVD